MYNILGWWKSFENISHDGSRHASFNQSQEIVLRSANINTSKETTTAAILSAINYFGRVTKQGRDARLGSMKTF